jgi:hypothetical protein
VEAVALVLVGSLITIAWPAVAWTRDRKDRAKASAAALQAARRSVAAEWLAHSAYLESALAVGRIVVALLPPSGAWERHADLIATSLSQEDWGVVVHGWIMVEHTRLRVTALAQDPLSSAPGTAPEYARAAFEDDDLESIRKAIAILDPATWRGIGNDGSITQADEAQH